MSVIDKVKKDYDQQSHQVITVEEWDETFIVKPMNLDEQRRLIEKQKVSEIEAIVDLLIMKLLKEDGKTKAFSLEDKKTLMTQARPDVLTKIVEQIGSNTTPATQKKLKSDPELFAIYQLAEILHKSVNDIMLMSVEEFDGWMAYFQLKDEQSRLKHGK